jgi:uncharacterized glyoxalase superfamily protein PhnB
MKLLKVIPTIFYADILIGLQLFRDCLGFTILHADLEAPGKFHIIERDGVELHLTEDAEFAAKDRPSIRIATDDIDALYREIKNKGVDLFHPNLPAIKKQPWGLKEFALLDKSGVCIILYENRPA